MPSDPLQTLTASFQPSEGFLVGGVDIHMLAQALGVPVFETPWHMPQYQLGEQGAWRLMRGGMGLDRGYYSGGCVYGGSTALLRKNAQGGWDTWMSLSPFEIESQELACRHAHGHTVVMGLGMGWVTANIALNPAVERVTVVERDPEVIALFQHMQVLEGLPPEAAAKIHIEQADALQWRPAPQQVVDWLYADIWLRLAEPQALAEVQQMQAHVQATQLYFWGQEWVLAAPLQASWGSPSWAPALAEAVAATRLPLLTAVDGGFAPWVERIWRERLARRPA
ncbi:hypothetical protein M2375_000106 [Comamonas sp. BIGb0152]|uniref:hypothetical protein n=1 Tax=Comamonas sp. BIGb0152 TaxID=2940601 RepID=UPI0021680A18|nr:hypothetical protein [Comamonas sp. BIGb0152]MCS4291911.1 hypothetical protein [Comamonas sp. BIGb0152]